MLYWHLTRCVWGEATLFQFPIGNKNSGVIFVLNNQVVKINEKNPIISAISLEDGILINPSWSNLEGPEFKCFSYRNYIINAKKVVLTHLLFLALDFPGASV